jgi:hypothetical protein
MRCFVFAVVTAFLLLGGAVRSQAAIVVTVDKSAQQLTVSVDGVTRHQWPVSTGRWGYNTPVGSYRPQRLERQWYSRKYDWSPMPYSIFFNGGYAIHGSNEISRLGRPASHGCIRLHPDNAAILFDLVKRNTGNTRIEITGSAPEPMAQPQRRSYEAATAVEESRARKRVIAEKRAARRRTVYDERPYRRGRATYDVVTPRRSASRHDYTFEEIFIDGRLVSRR